MSKVTRATQALRTAGVPFTVHTYAYDPAAERVGLQAAEALGESPDRVLKTLIATVDGKPVCAIIPSDRELSMKRLAAVFGGKSAAMIAAADAERITGYVIGGISPFGQKRRLRTAIAEEAMIHERVYINGGGRGLQVNLSPRDAARVLDAIVALLAA
jgi:Cys-tRNA(Pro)/Cys-tRNA(Cys) deacylase